MAKTNLATPTARNRRTLYLLNRRIYNPSLLSVFGKPIVTSGVCQREDAAVALQSLAMMNDGFVAEQAAQLAARVMSVADQATNSQIELAYRLAFSRRPSPIEMQWSHELLEKQAELFSHEESTNAEVHRKALNELCQALMNTNEFLYLE